MITAPQIQVFFSPNALCFTPKMQQKCAAPVPTDKLLGSFGQIQGMNKNSDSSVSQESYNR